MLDHCPVKALNHRKKGFRPRDTVGGVIIGWIRERRSGQIIVCNIKRWARAIYPSKDHYGIVYHLFIFIWDYLSRPQENLFLKEQLSLYDADNLFSSELVRKKHLLFRNHIIESVPRGIRTPVAGLKGRCPRPG